MRILLTNDDGVGSAGIWQAARALAPLGEVIVSAPDREQSGTGGAVSLLAPVRVHRARSPISGVTAFAVEGTPADSVILALERFVEGPVDLLVSGINQGANFGEDIFLSGTVGAALQGYFRGIPSIAISVAALHRVRYRAAGVVLRALAGRFVEWSRATEAARGLTPTGIAARPPLLNINLPNVAPARMKGVEVTHLGHRAYADSIQEGDEGRRAWYWIRRERPDWEEEEGSDIWAIRRRKVSITPIITDVTAFAALPELTGIAQAMQEALTPPGRRPAEGGGGRGAE